MHNRLIAGFLAGLLLLAGIATIRAADFTDTEAHWARDYIDEAVSLGLFRGVSDTLFAPESEMTRAMFVAVLGRLHGVSTADWEAQPLPFHDVPADAYYAPYLRWAYELKIVNGMSGTEFAPDSPVTREQMAKMLDYYVQSTGSSLRAQTAEDIPFADTAEVAPWAAESVEVLRRVGLFTGAPNDDGTLSFLPQKTATRAECATVFCRLREALCPPETEVPSQSPAESLEPTEPTEPVDPSEPTDSEEIASASESYEEKCLRVFGTVTGDPRLYYDSADNAEADMLELDVPVWRLSADGSKTAGTLPLTVHKSLAATVRAIFEEIFNGEEQFPIYSVLGYVWSGKSEHSIGCAIDINPNENYYCYPDGTAIVGNYWKPYEDPYSIPPDGDVVTAFANHGFTQGIYWNSGYKDYMHFSFFGT